uniref:Uncharacterized protein n=1 Tax=Arundo donax TaxID=35708 RepID=A0A0A9AYP3_ARUDO
MPCARVVSWIITCVV